MRTHQGRGYPQKECDKNLPLVVLLDVHLAVYSFSLPSYIHFAVPSFKYLLFAPKVHIDESTGSSAPRGLVDIMKICGWDKEEWEEYDGVGKDMPEEVWVR